MVAFGDPLSFNKLTILSARLNEDTGMLDSDWSFLFSALKRQEVEAPPGE